MCSRPEPDCVENEKDRSIIIPRLRPSRWSWQPWSFFFFYLLNIINHTHHLRLCRQSRFQLIIFAILPFNGRRPSSHLWLVRDHHYARRATRRALTFDVTHHLWVTRRRSLPSKGSLKHTGDGANQERYECMIFTLRSIKYRRGSTGFATESSAFYISTLYLKYVCIQKTMTPVTHLLIWHY